MRQKIIGVLALSSVGLFLLIGLLILFSGQHFRAANAQLALFLITAIIAFSGMYLLQWFCPATPTNRKVLIGALGVLFMVLGVLVCFNIVDFLAGYNWLISLGILYILLVQLQLLNWGKESNLFSKICAYALIAANAFLFIFFIVQWRYHAVAIWIDIAVITSVISFVIGTFVSKKPVLQEKPTV